MERVEIKRRVVLKLPPSSRNTKLTDPKQGMPIPGVVQMFADFSSLKFSLQTLKTDPRVHGMLFAIAPTFFLGVMVILRVKIGIFN